MKSLSRVASHGLSETQVLSAPRLLLLTTSGTIPSPSLKKARAAIARLTAAVTTAGFLARLLPRTKTGFSAAASSPSPARGLSPPVTPVGATKTV